MLESLSHLVCLGSAGCRNTTSSNKNIFLLEVMSSLEKALIAQSSSYGKETPGACHLGTYLILVLMKVMRTFTSFKLLFIPQD